MNKALVSAERNKSPGRSKRSRTSPEILERQTKKTALVNTAVVDMDKKMMDHFASLLDSKLAALSDSFSAKLASLSTKEDIQRIRDDFNKLGKENVQLKKEIDSLKLVNYKNESLIEELEIKSRNNNLIFKGIKFNSNDFSELAVTFCTEVLKIELAKDNIYAHPLGPVTAPGTPLLVSFVRLQDKFAVLNASKVLRNTGFAVHQDLPMVTRKKRAKISLLRRECLRLNPQLKINMKNNCFFVQGQKFSWCHYLGVRFLEEDGISKLNELVGTDVTEFVTALRTDTLPKDYFSSKGPLQGSFTPRKISSVPVSMSFS